MEREPLRVLLVEDETSLREPLARHLRSAYDYQVDTAADAAKAWQLVSEISHIYDVALIDDLLTPEPDAEPEPIGVELVERIRARCAETECILFTGWGMDRALAALRAGAYRYLAKPLNLDELGITIRMAAEQAHLRRERDLLSITLEISNAMVKRLSVTQTLEAIAEAIPRLGGAKACAVALEDPATRRVRYQTRILIGDVKVRWQRHMQDVFLTRQIIDSSQAFVMSDVDAHADQVDENLRQAGIKSFAGIPIPGEPRNQGVLYAYSTHREAFGTYEQRVLTLLANQAAIALQNAHLFEAETQRRREAETLRELGVALNASLKLEEVLDRVAMSCQRLIHAETSTALIYDERRKNYIQRGVADHPERPVVVREPRPDGYTRRVIETGEPLIVSDLIQDARARADHLELGIRSMAAVPIQLADKTIGVLFVHSTVPQIFDDHKVALLSVLANQAAIAISNAQYFDENAHRMKELEHLHRAAEKLASVASVRDVLQQIVRSAREVLAADSAVIWSYDQVRHTFLPDELVADGIQPELVDSFRRDEPRYGGTAEIVMERNYLAVPDVDAPEYTFLAPPGRGLRGAIDAKAFQGIALRAGDETLGVLYVNYQQARSFGAKDRATLQTLAYHAALTLKKARLLDQVSKARDAARVVAQVSVLEDLSKTLHSVARGIRHALDCDAVTLYAYDQRRAQFEFPPTMSGVRIADQVIELGRVSKKSVIWRILALGETYVAEDAASDSVMRGPFVQREGIQSSVGIPLRVGDCKVGVMFVNYRDRHRFTGEELTNIELFANQAAVAIRNAQLYEETIRRANALEALYEAGKVVTSTLALDEILNRIVEQARNLTGHHRKQAHFCDLELMEGSKLKRKAAYPPQHLTELKKRVGEIDLEQNEHIGITGRAAKAGQSQLVGDVTRDPDYIAYDPETRSELAVPIKIGEKVIGVINVEHPDHNAFDQDDQRDLESLAAQAAIAIDNARLYQIERQRVEELAGLDKISQSIRSLTNIYQVYKQVSESIAQLVGAQMCGVLLYDRGKEALVCQLPMHGVSDEIGRRYRIPVGEDVPTRAMWKARDSLVLNDVDHHPWVAMLGLEELAQEAGLRDTLFAKLTTGNRDIGVIQASNKLDGTPFNEDDARLLCIFAGQAAAVIENARLYEELRRSKGIIGARTALAWMGMASSAWRHTIDRHAVTIRELAQLFRQDWTQVPSHEQGTTVGERIATIEHLATRILEKPITPPLSTEAGLEQVSLSALIGERAKQLWQSAPYKKAVLQLDLALPESATMRANPEWLRRAFDMLVDNAVQAVADRDIKEIVIGSRTAAVGAEILVSDTGPGIPEEIQAKIGLELIEKPQDAEGMGMGLLMAQTIVQTYGGEIRVAATGPTGTTMVIWLPVENDASERGQ
jgi:GAF domain-containing protein